MHIFRHIFLSNYWWQKSDIWSQIPPLLEGGEGVYCFTFVRPSVRLSKIFFVTFFSVTVDGRNLIFGHKLHIGTPYRGKRFWTHQIPTSCLPTLLIFKHIEHTFCICPFLIAFLSNYWWQKSAIWSQVSYRYPISWEAFFDPSDSYFLFAEERGYHKWALAHSSSCWIFIGLAHWNNSLWIDMSLHYDTLSWFRANQSFLFLLNTVCLA
jgi:hypothetical protein